MTRRVRLACETMVVVLAALLAGCDRLHPPVVYNATDFAVDLRVEWRDGTADVTAVKPGGLVHIGRLEVDVAVVSVHQGDRELMRITGEEIEELGRAVGPDVVGIAIEDAGFRPLSAREVETIHAGDDS